jgi:CheY-like chemotaxis protein
MEVLDKGVGISENVKKKMFDPFFSTSKELTGLGLSACLGIVRSHGGAMSVESKEGEGTSIRVLFPATIKAEVESSVEPMVLLVVDNDPAVLEITRNLLHNLDHEALAVGSGHEAVDLFINRHHEIDGVLLDKTMPGMSGLECFNILKSIDSEIPVVIMTGYDESSVEHDFGVGNVAAILPKPFQVSGLLAALANIQLSKLSGEQTV